MVNLINFLNIEPVARVNITDWIILPMVFLLIVLAYINYKERVYLVSLFRSYVGAVSIRANDNDAVRNGNASFLLLLNGVIGVGALIHLVNIQLDLSLIHI